MKKMIQWVDNYLQRRAIKHFLLAMSIAVLLSFPLFYSMANEGYSQYSSVDITEHEEHFNQQQRKVITGTVVDESGTPVIGANVIEIGTANGTVTDIDGNFSLRVNSDARIRVTYIGYFGQDIDTGDRTTLSITLQEDTQALDEVVVIGYGTQRRITTTGAITSVSNEDLIKAPVAGVSNALTGLTSGLQSVQVSGEFGNDRANIRIQSIGTLYTGGAAPLIL